MNNWISTKDSLPEYDKDVLIYIVDGSTKFITQSKRIYVKYRDGYKWEAPFYSWREEFVLAWKELDYPNIKGE